jgi:hypothetical protein
MDVTLEAYQLIAFTLAPEIAVTDFHATPARDVAVALEAEARQALGSLDAAAAHGLFITGAAQIRSGIQAALAGQSGLICGARSPVMPCAALASS